MFARMVTTHLKPGKMPECTRMLEKEIIPLLRKQEGFRDEVSFFDDTLAEGVAISFWDTKDFADKYDKDIYPKVLKKLEELYEDVPRVKRFEVTNSTWLGIHVS